MPAGSSSPPHSTAVCGTAAIVSTEQHAKCESFAFGASAVPCSARQHRAPLPVLGVSLCFMSFCISPRNPFSLAVGGYDGDAAPSHRLASRFSVSAVFLPLLAWATQSVWSTKGAVCTAVSLVADKRGRCAVCASCSCRLSCLLSRVAWTAGTDFQGLRESRRPRQMRRIAVSIWHANLPFVLARTHNTRSTLGPLTAVGVASKAKEQAAGERLGRKHPGLVSTRHDPTLHRGFTASFTVWLKHGYTP